MRVFELGKQLDIPSKELIELCDMLGIEGKKASSGLTEEQVAEIIEAATGEATDPLPALSEPAATAAVETPAAVAVEEETPETDQPEAAPELEAAAEEAPAEEESVEEEAVDEGPQPLEIFGPIRVRDLAEQLDLKPNVIVAELMKKGIFATINQDVDNSVAKEVAEKHGFDVLLEPKKVEPPPPPPEPEVVEPEPAAGQGAEVPVDAPAVSKPAKVKVKKNKNKAKKEKVGKGGGSAGEAGRPPVVTFLGHVDHGKTSLLDRIRQGSVAAGEAGGITQHIGAYTVSVGDSEITFLDTPGHAAFTKMRARGANLTDIAIVVVGADEGIKPQTLEAIQHAQSADVELMIAINKIDLPTANVDNVKAQMQQEGLLAEDWGGDVIMVPVSAHTGDGIDELLEMINLQAEVLELKASPSGKAEGYVIEAQLEPGMGPTASVLVTDGSLKVGDAVICGEEWGKVKALIDHTGERVKKSTPSHAVKILGLSNVPAPGEKFEVLKNDRMARKMSDELKEEKRIAELRGPERKASLDDLFANAGILTDMEELSILLKCDVRGSLEALTNSLDEIESDKVKLKYIAQGIGNITENDIALAAASNAIVIGFNVAKDNAAVRVAKREGVEIRLYDLIYELIDEVRAAMQGLLQPVVKERVIGHAEIRALFKLNRGGNVAGCMVVDGKIRSTARARVLRGKDEIYLGAIASLKRFQDEAAEVSTGQECGIRLQNFNDFETGDVVEAYETEMVQQSL